MAFPLFGYVLQCGRIFRGAELPVLVAIANNTNKDGVAWPSEDEIAWNSCVSNRHVRRILKRLQRLGILTINVGGGWRSNRYYLNECLLREMAKTIKRVKDEAVKDGADRYAAMKRVAADIRSQLEASAYAETELCVATEASQTLPEEDTASAQIGQSAVSPDSGAGATGHITHQTLSKPLKNLRVIIPKKKEKIPDVGEQVESARKGPHYRDRALRIESLAAALGIPDVQLIRNAGGPARADQLANDVFKGTVELEQVEECFLGPESMEKGQRIKSREVRK